MKTICSFLLAMMAQSTFAIVVNGYAKVTAVSATTVNVTNVNETNDSFEDGEYVIIMQMQDDVIGGFTTNSVTFGSLSSIASAGLYEVLQIASHTETAGVPTSFTFTALPNNVYNIGNNSSVQLITYPKLGSPNYTLNSIITSVAWNGNIGGVVAFEVAGTLYFNNNIDVSNAGFRGGIKNLGSATSCTQGTYISSPGANFANKGEGIYKINTTTNANFQAARAKILNGGGGGNSHNAGGGGGANCGAGGDGGPGADLPYCMPSAGGYGGISLSSSISVNRVFMGGGGGSGEGNEGNATAGGNGGGIVLLKATTISAVGTGNTFNIMANGTSVTFPSFADGSGGGGGGGSVVIQVYNWSLGTNTLTIQANGGNGGNVQSPFVHGGGGGGGNGVVFCAAATPANVIIQTSSGSGGKNDDPVTFYASDGQADVTCNAIVSAPLPIELISFTATVETNGIALHWETASEVNNDYFVVLQANDAIHYQEVCTVPGNGNATTYHAYECLHEVPHEDNYYMLKQVDYDGASKLYGPIYEKYNETSARIQVFPNPTSSWLTIRTDDGLLRKYVITNYLGQPLKSGYLKGASTIIEVSDLLPGMYFMLIGTETFKFIKQNK